MSKKKDDEEVQQTASWIQTLNAHMNISDHISDHVQKYELPIKVQKKANWCQAFEMH